MPASAISSQGYYEIYEELSRLEDSILRGLKLHGDTTPKAIASRMGLPTATISGRISRLKDRGFVKVIGKTRCPKSNRPNSIVTVTATGEAYLAGDLT